MNAVAGLILALVAGFLLACANSGLTMFGGAL